MRQKITKTFNPQIYLHKLKKKNVHFYTNEEKSLALQKYTHPGNITF